MKCRTSPRCSRWCAAPLGVSVPTVSQWLGVLETTAQIFVVPPFYESFGRRLTKSPKVYLADPGLACHLLGIETEAELAKSPFLGSLFEGFIAAEIVKSQVNAGRRREIYFFRGEQGLEVDFVAPARGGSIRLIECEASRTVTPAMAAALRKLGEAMRKQRRSPVALEMLLVHAPPKNSRAMTTVAPGVRAVPWPRFVGSLA